MKLAPGPPDRASAAPPYRCASIGRALSKGHESHRRSVPLRAPSGGPGAAYARPLDGPLSSLASIARSALLLTALIASPSCASLPAPEPQSVAGCYLVQWPSDRAHPDVDSLWLFVPPLPVDAQSQPGWLAVPFQARESTVRTRRPPPPLWRLSGHTLSIEYPALALLITAKLGEPPQAGRADTWPPGEHHSWRVMIDRIVCVTGPLNGPPN